jgi:hypothetical protein
LTPWCDKASQTMEFSSTDPNVLREKAKNYRRLAQEADHLELIGKLLRMADEIEIEANRRLITPSEA